MAAAAQLTPGAVAAIAEHVDGYGRLKPLLQVMEVSERSMLMVLSDGVHTLQFMLSHAEEQRITDGSIVKGTIVHLQEFTCNTIQHRRIIFIIKLGILQSECAIIGSPVPYGSMNVPSEQGPNVAAAAAQTYGATYSGDPGLPESSVAPRASQVANNQGADAPAIDNVGLPTYIFLFPFTGRKNFEQNVPRLDCFDSSLAIRATYTYNGHETGSNEDSHEYDRNEKCRSIFSNWIDSTENSYEYYRHWVIHEEHRKVCIQGLRVKNELFRHLTPGEEVCEIAFRAFKRIELQNSMKARIHVRRHFVTIDWARYALVYKPDHELWDDIFSSKWNGYDVAYCQMDRLMDFRNSLAYHIVRIDGNTGYCPEKAMAIN
ncbi:hypothetical protein EJB05_34405, partial [Eragrostis curvula]